MAAAEDPSSGGLDARMRLLCSHGGRLVPRGPDGALRYAGGETRVLVVPRAAAFRDLVARLAEIAGGAEVRAVEHRLADAGLEDVIVSVTCDEELAHMRDEYDRLRATRPTAGFRVFVSATPSSSNSDGGVLRPRAATGVPPLAPKLRRVQSEQALAARALLHRRPTFQAPVRRVQSAQELAGASGEQLSLYHRSHERRRCCCHGPDLCAPTPPPARPMYPLPYMSKNFNGVRPGGQEAALPTAKATGRVAFPDAAREKARCRDAQAAMEKGRAIWQVE